MNEEEKNAIEYFKDINQLYFSTDLDLKYTDSEFENSIILLNLIEKQQNRIDELEKALVEEAIKSTEKINKLKDKLTGDKMEQFDDYIIYLIESYLEILEE